MPRKPPTPPKPPPRKASTGPQRDPAAGPLSRIVMVDRLRVDIVTEMTVTADADERAALAEINGLERVDRLEGRFRIARQAGGVQVTGEVEAEVVQTCVVSLEPFPAVVREPVDVRFAPEAEVDALEAAAARRSGDGLEDVADLADVPDPIIDGRIDIGVLTAEFLSLGLDPHPRKPGAVFAAETDAEESEAASKVSPFAALRGRAAKP